MKISNSSVTEDSEAVLEISGLWKIFGRNAARIIGSEIQTAGRDEIRDKLDNAITNARRVEQFHQTSGADNPSTMVHSLVEYLRDLKKQ